MQLLSQPDFSKILGEFFGKACTYFSINALTSKESRLALDACVSLGIITRLSVEAIVPESGRYFPDFTNMTSRSYLFMLSYLALDPSTASNATKQQAVYTICRGMVSLHSSEMAPDNDLKNYPRKSCIFGAPSFVKK